jgi:hypothetical protein
MLGVCGADAGHLERIQAGQNLDQDLFVRAESLHRFAEGIRFCSEVAWCDLTGDVTQRWWGWSSHGRSVLSGRAVHGSSGWGTVRWSLGRRGIALWRLAVWRGVLLGWRSLTIWLLLLGRIPAMMSGRGTVWSWWLR